MTQLGFITVSGLVYLATRITKAIVVSKLNDRDRVLSDIVVGVDNYSHARKSNNKNVKKSIAEAVGDSKLLDKVIARVEGKQNRSILRSVRNLIFKIINIVI